MRVCSVVGCTRVKKNPKISLHKIPNDLKLAWNTAVNKVNNQKKPLKYVCSEHFTCDDFITSYSVPSDICSSVSIVDGRSILKRYNMYIGNLVL